MEKTTKKKRKKTKSLKRRIGIIAVGGLSLVLTVCLSVGATLAWFAGSTWASKSLYMGGPVYVEMAGRSQGTGGADTDWVGGQGNLDIKAIASTRTTGTVDDFDTDGSGTADTGAIKNVTQDEVLLPGQKVEIYSQARVYTTAATDTIGDDAQVDLSSGANTTNTSNAKENAGVTTYYTENGRVTTSTSSVLRARFSINIEFDPSVGFNNFTDPAYMVNYPVQSKAYTGDSVSSEGAATAGGTSTDGLTITGGSNLKWYDALDAGDYKINASTGKPDKVTGKVARRDAVASTVDGDAIYTNKYLISAAATDKGKEAEAGDDKTAMEAIQAGDLKSIYKWRYCSEKEWTEADGTTVARMGYPFNGGDKFKNINGYYGLWYLDAASDHTAKLTESDTFYKARCNAYLQSYVEYYVNEYGNTVTRTIEKSITALDTQLNQYFVQLVNDSSDKIIADLKAEDGSRSEYASWLYIDPTIGNDTNSNEISTSTGGWWYLVSCDDKKVGGKDVTAQLNAINTEVDDASTANYGKDGYDYNQTNTPAAAASLATFKRSEKGATSEDRLKAKLFEIKKFTDTNETVGYNIVKNKSGRTATPIHKVVSMSFPFVNGTFALPTDALTNVFANAKISFQISFQAMQAFFPYTETIDKIKYDDALLGTRKALNIENAIPIYNEAFDYEENTTGGVAGL